MNLVGISINVSGKEKFVGKVGEYNGKRIFYREANFSDFHASRSQSLGVDKKAADYAHDILKADWMLCWCKDTKDLYYVRMPFESATVEDLGELPQYRIPVSEFTRKEDREAIKLGFTKNVVKL